MNNIDWASVTAFVITIAGINLLARFVFHCPAYEVGVWTALWIAWGGAQK
jgi:hypothetical protein